jgi:hypothetical protein
MNRREEEIEKAYREGRRQAMLGRGLYYSGPYAGDFLRGARDLEEERAECVQRLKAAGLEPEQED